MFKVKIFELGKEPTTIYLAYDKEKIIYNTKLTLQQNAVHNFQFDINKNSVATKKINFFTTCVGVLENEKILFLGRVLEIDKNVRNDLTVYCEGGLSFLNDTVLEPYEFEGSVEDYVKKIIFNHNAKLNTYIYSSYSIGTITVKDKNDLIVRSSEDSVCSMEELKNKVITAFNGYFKITPIKNSSLVTGDKLENYIMQLDYLEEFKSINNCVLEYGKNILDITKKNNVYDVGTRVYAYGKKDDTTKKRVDISSVNSGKLYVESLTYQKKYGIIEKNIFFDDVNEPKILRTKAIRELNKIVDLYSEIEVSAIPYDTKGNLLDIYKKVHVKSKFHGIDDYFIIDKMEIDLFQPSNNKIQLTKVLEEV